MMKITFINPPSPFQDTPAMDIPLGLGYIISYLKSKKYDDISFIDFNTLNFDYDKTDYLDTIPEASNVYGISVATPHFYYYYCIAKHIREINPKATIVAGGPHPTARPHECLNKTETDIVIRGEAEEAFHNLLSQKTYPDIEETYVIENLDSLPFPDRTLVDISKYERTLNSKRAFHVVSCRHCPYSCSFCSKKVIGTNYRVRSVDNFIAELDFYNEEYNVDSFIIYDDTFTINRDRAIKIAKEMGKRNYFWRCFTRTDKLDARLLRVFKDNNITSITLGVETFSSKMLKIYNKNTTLKDNVNALELCKEAGIPVRCSLIYGGPYETKETLSTTIKHIGELQPDEWNIATFVPIPGSDVGDNPSKYNVKIHSDSYYRNYHRVGESGMGEILMDISTMSEEEYVENRHWFIDELEAVCPRQNIQDTIQNLVIR